MKRDSLEAAVQRIASLHGTVVTVGVQGEVAEGDATLPELVVIATANEFGTASIPSRPFLRTAARIKGKRWARGFADALRARVRHRDPAAPLRRIGLRAVADVQASIRDGDWAPNAPSTIARKGSDKPLIDSGQLRQSIRAAVELPGRASELVG